MKTVLITGGSSGIGLQTAIKLCNLGYNVIITSRNNNRGEQACNKINQVKINGEISFRCLDLVNRSMIKSFVLDLEKDEVIIDIFINNAGIMMPPFTKTINNQELQFDTNHLGHVLLANLLKNKLAIDSRIVILTSITAHNLSEIKYDITKKKYSRYGAYCNSKYANALFGMGIAKNWNQEIILCHPGITRTNIVSNWPIYLRIFARFSNLLRSIAPVENAADIVVYAAILPSLITGDYIGPNSKYQWNGVPIKIELPKNFVNEENIDRLWDYSNNELSL